MASNYDVERKIANWSYLRSNWQQLDHGIYFDISRTETLDCVSRRSLPVRPRTKWPNRKFRVEEKSTSKTIVDDVGLLGALLVVRVPSCRPPGPLPGSAKARWLITSVTVANRVNKWSENIFLCRWQSFFSLQLTKKRQRKKRYSEKNFVFIFFFLFAWF